MQPNRARMALLNSAEQLANEEQRKFSLIIIKGFLPVHNLEMQLIYDSGATNSAISCKN